MSRGSAHHLEGLWNLSVDGIIAKWGKESLTSIPPKIVPTASREHGH
ncbi:hypothetical protein Plim_2284 [Planctopirus limnophila DSM 3776]|uniref:Uncharacterized protein n=1 Tax=Planctopirus limnophila (strain ATCC 43296 / DSM 3776 / IFAM 1008 / Mu 290) TaxID=521674 RepID=D5SNJ6_PLAL2|nr:hypothetical protein Plim_2284 [Planctopirus limnophila DSM 3776]